MHQKIYLDSQQPFYIDRKSNERKNFILSPNLKSRHFPHFSMIPKIKNAPRFISMDEINKIWQEGHTQRVKQKL